MMYPTPQQQQRRARMASAYDMVAGGLDALMSLGPLRKRDVRKLLVDAERYVADGADDACRGTRPGTT